VRSFAYILLALFLASCGPTITADFNSPEPAARNAAIVKAAEHKDKAAVPDLVRMLDSDDPATRLLAIDALERITGETLGFEASAPEMERRHAVDRWQARVQADHSASPQKGAS
jgi:HEAT repeat protein